MKGAILLVLRLVLGGVFLVLGTLKVQDPLAFLKALREYAMLPAEPTTLTNGVAAVVPWVEIVLGLLLLLGVAVRGAALASLLMLIVFTGAIAKRAAAERELRQVAYCAVEFDCGCGTGVENVCEKLAQNGGLILLSGALLFSRGGRFTLRRDLVR